VPITTLQEEIRKNMSERIETWTPSRALTQVERACKINFNDRHKRSEGHVVATTTRLVDIIRNYQLSVVGQVKRLRILETKNYKKIRDVTIGPVGNTTEGPKQIKDTILNASVFIYLEGKQDALEDVEKSLDSRVKFQVYDSTPTESLQNFRKRFPVTKREFGELIAREKAKAFTAAGIIEKDMLRDVQLILFKAMEQGWTLEQFQQALERSEVKYTGTVYGSDRTGLPISPVHTETMLRTNFAEVYGLGRDHLFNDKDVISFVPAFEYSAILDTRTRESHWKMDGRIYNRGDAIWLEWNPPSGYNCRCIRLPVTVNIDYIVSSPTNLLPDPGFGGIREIRSPAQAYPAYS
jgi:SPP1 gp7 family putative phage head morphogenesis protein